MTDNTASGGTHLPVKSYLICAIPRTGSYLLCDSLSATGVAGRPNEYFSPAYQGHWSKVWETKSYTQYLDRVVDTTTTPNGIAGVKTHPWQFDSFSRQATGRRPVFYAERPAVLAQWFPNLQYVWLRRRNKLQQAISYARSLQTNIWWDAEVDPVPNATTEPEALRFDFELLTQSVARMVEEDSMWERYFEVIGVSPFVFEYEDLVDDIDGSVRSVLDFLGLELPTDYQCPAPRFRRQADEITANWERLYRMEIARGPYVLMQHAKNPVAAAATAATSATDGRATATVGAGPSAQAMTSRISEATLTLEVPEVDLESVLASRHWLRRESPFPHVYATQVFKPDIYQSMADQAERLLSEGNFSRSIPGYDASAYSITSRTQGPLSIFLSRSWHDMLARMFQVESTGELNVALHHHAVGSLSGSPHNDLNPGWFLVDSKRSDGLTVHDPKDGCHYQFGPQGQERAVERTRAVAVIMYLSNPVGRYSGGETGLYRSASDPIDRPAASIPPINNSLLAFECTTHSLHGFMTNPYASRTCLVMWLHRDKEETVRRFGESSIVYWTR
jgi:LPS sulfotransferase NodH